MERAKLNIHALLGNRISLATHGSLEFLILLRIASFDEEHYGSFH